MALLLRRAIAAIAACGLALSVGTYFASYFGASMDSLWHWALPLHLGIFALYLPVVVLERSSMKGNIFFWEGFKVGRPSWTRSAITAVALLFVLHFVFFLIVSHAAAPEIKDGDYVLNNHGRIVKVLTYPQYLFLKGAELRIFATGWMFFYFTLVMYWWFPKVRQLVF